MARYIDADDEPIDVVAVVAQQLYTWQAKHHIFHAVAVRALRSWAVLPDFWSVVVFVIPDRAQWRMQYIEQEIESYRDHLYYAGTHLLVGEKICEIQDGHGVS